MNLTTHLKTKSILILLILCIGIFVHETKAQDRKVSGVITSSSGEVLPGVNVLIKGTTTGGITDFNGKYEINVPNGETILIYSFIGYHSKEVTVGTQSLIDLQLLEDAEELEEVVVIGFGEQKKENITGSLETMGDKAIKDRPVTSTSQLLQGTMSGVVAMQNSGQPGADNMNISIRGASSINDTPALVIIDGMPADMNSINPQDIESLTVLKDASATAIYGARAAGGVILIKTKSGEEGKVRMNYSGYIGLQTPTNEPTFVDEVGYMEMRNTARRNDDLAPLFSESDIEKYRTGELKGTSWRDELLRKSAVQQQHNLSLSGGTDKVKYFASTSYFNQEGLTANTNYDRFNMRMNVDAKVNDRLTTHIRTHIAKAQRLQPTNSLQQALLDANAISPLEPVKYDNGEWNYTRNGNPVLWMEEGGNRTSDWMRTQLMLGADYKVAEGLTAFVDYNMNYMHDRGKAFRNSHDYRDANGDLVKSEPNWFEDYNSSTFYSGLQARLDYEKNWANHYFKAMVGYSQELQQHDRGAMTRYNYLTNSIHVIDGGSVDPQDWQMYGTADHWAIQSVYARVNYAFKDRYLFEANVRVDGSSKFSPQNRWGVFPSVSLGWRVKEEAFLKDVDWLTNLKVRGSAGQVGNQNIPYYDWTATLATTSAVIGDQGVAAAYYDKTANPDIKWETKTAYNFGIDADFWGRLLGFSVDIFKNRTNDILMNVPVPPQFGYSAPRVNAGVVDNNGWEISIRHENSIGDFNYFVNVNMFDNRNNVVDIKNTGPWIEDQYYFTDVGTPIRAWYGFKSDGIYQTDEEAKANTAHWEMTNGKIGAGDIKLVDVNGDGVIDGDDRELIGDPNPHYMFGINLGGSYKGWDFNILFNGALQRDVILFNEINGPAFNNSTPHTWMIEKAWPNTNEYPRIREEYTYNDPGTYLSDFWIQDGKYIRLKNITVGYTFDANFLNKIGAGSARVYLSGDNLWNSSGLFDGAIDPEIENGTRGANYPQLAVYSMGFNINF